MAKSYLTTSQAAKKLFVSPDTVLKWVKAGKIKAHRTLGGHFRIPTKLIDDLIEDENRHHSKSLVPVSENPSFQYCWEHQSQMGILNAKCTECVVYKSRARRCYELRDIPEEFGSLKLYCKGSCEKCDYYKLVNNLGLNVLIISNNNRLLSAVRETSIDEKYHIQTVSSEYECASTIEKFRPDFVIVDCSMGAIRTRELCNHIADDDRVPFTRLILTSKKNRLGDFCDREIFGWIRKPFTMRKLQRCIEGVTGVAA